MNNEALVSTILPVYNGERYLGEAIESILSDPYRPMEIIVIDDGSTDATFQVVERYPCVHYHFQPNQGSAAARNYGVSLATGNFFTFADADDLCVNEKVNRLMQAFQENPELEIAFGCVEQFGSPELPQQINWQNKERTSLVGYVPGGIMIRRASFFRVGLFEPNLQMGEVLDWFLRAKEKKLKEAILPDVIYRRRFHTTNKGVTQRSLQTEYVRVLKASLDRRRSQARHNILPDE
jgi:glycosyltransferase involved in cell wall biosynthesis